MRFHLDSGTIQKHLAVAVSTAFLSTTLAAPWAEANIWQERRKTLADRNGGDGRNFARLPGSLNDAFPGLQSPLSRVTRAPEEALGASVPPALRADFRRLPSALTSLPASLGEVRQVRLAKDPARRPLVVHVQDVHGYTDAQLNIAGVIERLAARGPVVVGVEGAAGAFDAASFRAFPDKQVMKDVAQFLVDQRMIAAAEYAAWTAPQEPVLWGVEDASLYEANGRAYKDSMAREKELKAALQAMSSALEARKAKAYPPALRDLDRACARFAEGTLELSSYLKALGAVARDASSFPNLALFSGALAREEKMDFALVEKERAQLIRRLAETLSKEEASALVERSLLYKTGDISYGSYYGHLQALCRAKGVDLSRFPAMGGYIAYVLASERIDKNALFSELSAAERRAVEPHLSTPGLRELHRLSRDLALAHKMSGFVMTPADWSEASARLEAIRALPSRIPASIGGFDFASALKPCETFCDTAINRNEALAGNLLKKLGEKPGPAVGVLVAGGFHTEGMVSFLESRDVSVVVVTPQIKEVKAGNDYLDFLREKAPLEKLFTQEKISYAKAVVASARTPLSDGKPAALEAAARLSAAVAARRRGLTPEVQKALDGIAGSPVAVDMSPERGGAQAVTTDVAGAKQTTVFSAESAASNADRLAREMSGSGAQVRGSIGEDRVVVGPSSRSLFNLVPKQLFMMLVVYAGVLAAGVLNYHWGWIESGWWSLTAFSILWLHEGGHWAYFQRELEALIIRAEKTGGLPPLRTPSDGQLVIGREGVSVSADGIHNPASRASIALAGPVWGAVTGALGLAAMIIAAKMSDTPLTPLIPVVWGVVLFSLISVLPLKGSDMEKYLDNRMPKESDAAEDLFFSQENPADAVKAALEALSRVDDAVKLRTLAVISERLQAEALLGPVSRDWALEAHRRLILAGREMENVSLARGVQIISLNSIAILDLIQKGVPGARNMRVTADPGFMLKAGDKDRGPSYIDARFLPEGVQIASKEGEPGLYWRGVEDMASKYKVDGGERVILYTMIHGWLPKAEGVSPVHITVMSPSELPRVTRYIGGLRLSKESENIGPNTLLLVNGTGQGHSQKSALDGKQNAGPGRIMQLNGTASRTKAQIAAPGEWVTALPGHTDALVNLGTPALTRHARASMTEGEVYEGEMRINGEGYVTDRNGNRLRFRNDVAVFYDASAPVEGAPAEESAPVLHQVLWDLEGYRRVVGPEGKAVSVAPNETVYAASQSLAEAYPGMTAAGFKKVHEDGLQTSEPALLASERVPKAWGQEIWHGSTQAGEGQASIVLADGRTESLKAFVQAHPEVLGKWARLLYGDALPIFSKFLTTNFEPFVHFGFKRRVERTEFMGWMTKEQELLRRLLGIFSVSSKKETDVFMGTYSSWAMKQSLNPDKDGGRWGSEVLDREFITAAAPFIKPGTPAKELENLLRDIRANRAQYAASVNLVDLRLELGNILLSPAGVAHAINGLSEQTHPLDATTPILAGLFRTFAELEGRGAPDAEFEAAVRESGLAAARTRNVKPPKNEAWLPIMMNGKLVLVEPQQLSNDTYSFADFTTPFVWNAEKNAMVFRKGDHSSGVSEATLAGYADSLDFSPMSPDDARSVPAPVPAGDRSSGAVLFRLVDDPVRWPNFTAYQLDLGAGGVFVGVPSRGSFQSLLVMEGEVEVRLAGSDRSFVLSPQGNPSAVVWATTPADYVITSKAGAKVFFSGLPTPYRTTPAGLQAPALPREGKVEGFLAEIASKAGQDRAIQSLVPGVGMVTRAGGEVSEADTAPEVIAGIIAAIASAPLPKILQDVRPDRDVFSRMAEAIPAARPQAPPVRILVVDDDRAILDSVGRILLSEHQGLGVLTSDTFEGALKAQEDAMAAGLPIDIVILDNRLDGMHKGLDLIPFIREAAARAGVPAPNFIFTSGSIIGPRELSGDVVFLPKPFNPSELMEVLTPIISEIRGRNPSFGAAAASGSSSLLPEGPSDAVLREALALLTGEPAGDLQAALWGTDPLPDGSMEEASFFYREISRLLNVRDLYRAIRGPPEMQKEYAALTLKFLARLAADLVREYNKPLSDVSQDEFNALFGRAQVVIMGGLGTRTSPSSIELKHYQSNGREETANRIVMAGLHNTPGVPPVMVAGLLQIKPMLKSPYRNALVKEGIVPEAWIDQAKKRELVPSDAVVYYDDTLLGYGGGSAKGVLALEESGVLDRVPYVEVVLGELASMSLPSATNSAFLTYLAAVADRTPAVQGMRKGGLGKDAEISSKGVGVFDDDGRFVGVIDWRNMHIFDPSDRMRLGVLKRLLKAGDPRNAELAARLDRWQDLAQSPQVSQPKGPRDLLVAEIEALPDERKNPVFINANVAVLHRDALPHIRHFLKSIKVKKEGDRYVPDIADPAVAARVSIEPKNGTPEFSPWILLNYLGGVWKGKSWPLVSVDTGKAPASLKDMAKTNDFTVAWKSLLMETLREALEGTGADLSRLADFTLGLGPKADFRFNDPQALRALFGRGVTLAGRVHLDSTAFIEDGAIVIDSAVLGRSRVEKNASVAGSVVEDSQVSPGRNVSGGVWRANEPVRPSEAVSDPKRVEPSAVISEEMVDISKEIETRDPSARLARSHDQTMALRKFPGKISADGDTLSVKGHPILDHARTTVLAPDMTEDETVRLFGRRSAYKATEHWIDQVVLGPGEIRTDTPALRVGHGTYVRPTHFKGANYVGDGWSVGGVMEDSILSDHVLFRTGPDGKLNNLRERENYYVAPGRGFLNSMTVLRVPVVRNSFIGAGAGVFSAAENGSKLLEADSIEDALIPEGAELPAGGRIAGLRPEEQRLAHELLILSQKSADKTLARLREVLAEDSLPVPGRLTRAAAALLFLEAQGIAPFQDMKNGLLKGLNAQERDALWQKMNLLRPIVGRAESAARRTSPEALSAAVAALREALPPEQAAAAEDFLSGGMESFEARWFYASLLRTLGLRDQAFQRTWHVRVPLAAEQRRWLAAVTPAYSFDKDGTLDPDNTSLGEASASLLAGLIARGAKVTTLTAKAMSELADKKPPVEIFGPLRRALLRELSKERWNAAQMNDIADDLLADYFEMYLDAGATVFHAAPGARTHADLVPDMSYSVGIGESDAAGISELLREPSLREALAEGRSALEAAGLVFKSDKSPMFPSGVKVDGGMLITKIGFMPFEFSVPEKGDPDEKAKRDASWSAREKVAKVLESLIRAKGLPLRTKVAGVRAVDLNVVMENGKAAQKDRAVLHLFSQGHRSVTFFGNETLKGNDLAARELLDTMRKDPAAYEGKSLRVVAVDRELDEAQREKVIASGADYVGGEESGTRKYLGEEIERMDRTRAPFRSVLSSRRLGAWLRWTGATYAYEYSTALALGLFGYWRSVVTVAPGRARVENQPYASAFDAGKASHRARDAAIALSGPAVSLLLSSFLLFFVADFSSASWTSLTVSAVSLFFGLPLAVIGAGNLLWVANRESRGYRILSALLPEDWLLSMGLGRGPPAPGIFRNVMEGGEDDPVLYAHLEAVPIPTYHYFNEEIKRDLAEKENLPVLLVDFEAVYDKNKSNLYLVLGNLQKISAMGGIVSILVPERLSDKAEDLKDLLSDSRNGANINFIEVGDSIESRLEVINGVADEYKNVQYLGQTEVLKEFGEFERDKARNKDGRGIFGRVFGRPDLDRRFGVLEARDYRVVSRIVGSVQGDVISRWILSQYVKGREKTDSDFKHHAQLYIRAQEKFMEYVAKSTILDPAVYDAKDVLALPKDVLELVVDPLGRRRRGNGGVDLLPLAVLKGGRGSAGMSALFEKLPGIRQEVVNAATDDGRSFAQMSYVFHTYFDETEGRMDSVTGAPDLGKSLLDLAEDRSAAKLLSYRLSEDIVQKPAFRGRGIKPDDYKPASQQDYIDALNDFTHNVAAPLQRLAAGEPVQWAGGKSKFSELMDKVSPEKRPLIAGYILKFWEAANSGIIQRELREYPGQMKGFVDYYKKLARSSPDLAMEGIYRGITDEFELEAKKPPVLDVVRLPLRSMMVIGARIAEGDWQKGLDSIARILDVKSEKGRVYRATKAGVHLVGLLKNGVLMPNENAINEVPRDGRGGLPHSFHLFPRPLTLTEIQRVNGKGSVRAKDDELKKLLKEMDFQQPEVNPEAVAALKSVKGIVFGNTTVYSNVAPALIPREIGDAILNSGAPTVLAANPVRENDPSTIDDNVAVLLRLINGIGPGPMGDAKGIDYVLGRFLSGDRDQISYIPIKRKSLGARFGIYTAKLQMVSLDASDDRVPAKYIPHMVTKGILSLIELWNLGYRVDPKTNRIVSHETARAATRPSARDSAKLLAKVQGSSAWNRLRGVGGFLPSYMRVLGAPEGFLSRASHVKGGLRTASGYLEARAQAGDALSVDWKLLDLINSVYELGRLPGVHNTEREEVLKNLFTRFPALVEVDSLSGKRVRFNQPAAQRLLYRETGLEVPDLVARDVDAILLKRADKTSLPESKVDFAADVAWGMVEDFILAYKLLYEGERLVSRFESMDEYLEYVFGPMGLSPAEALDRIDALSLEEFEPFAVRAAAGLMEKIVDPATLLLKESELGALGRFRKDFERSLFKVVDEDIVKAPETVQAAFSQAFRSLRQKDGSARTEDAERNVLVRLLGMTEAEMFAEAGMDVADHRQVLGWSRTVPPSGEAPQGEPQPPLGLSAGLWGEGPWVHSRAGRTVRGLLETVLWTFMMVGSFGFFFWGARELGVDISQDDFLLSLAYLGASTLSSAVFASPLFHGFKVWDGTSWRAARWGDRWSLFVIGMAMSAVLFVSLMAFVGLMSVANLVPPAAISSVQLLVGIAVASLAPADVHIMMNERRALRGLPRTAVKVDGRSIFVPDLAKLLPEVRDMRLGAARNPVPELQIIPLLSGVPSGLADAAAENPAAVERAFEDHVAGMIRAHAASTPDASEDTVLPVLLDYADQLHRALRGKGLADGQRELLTEMWNAQTRLQALESNLSDRHETLAELFHATKTDLRTVRLPQLADELGLSPENALVLVTDRQDVYSAIESLPGEAGEVLRSARKEGRFHIQVRSAPAAGEKLKLSEHARHFGEGLKVYPLRILLANPSLIDASDLEDLAKRSQAEILQWLITGFTVLIQSKEMEDYIKLLKKLAEYA